jgi:quercetin dioxygenase-like cupin family protein
MSITARVFGLLSLAFVLAFAIFALPSAALAADAMGDATFINPSEITWGDAPPVLPKGAKIAVLSGDPFKPGPFVARLRLPAGYKIPPHWHTQAENLTVISGSFFLGTGDTMDPAHAHQLKAGGFHYLPPKAHHSAYTKEKTVLQIHGEGPFDITYINPADDPSKAKK